jgi:hypothetical protein
VPRKIGKEDSLRTLRVHKRTNTALCYPDCMRRALFLLALAGCTYATDPAQNESTIVTPGNFRAGSGVIENIAVVPNKGTKEKEPHLYRLYIRMDVGGFQTVDVEDNSFFAGEAVNLTNDGRVERVSGTAFQDLFKKQ